MADFHTYPSYKNSEIEWSGSIPTTWYTVKVGLIYEITLGKMIQTIKKDKEDKLVPYLKANNVQDNFINYNFVDSMYASEREIEKYEVQIGDLLVCEGGEVARSAFMTKSINYCIFQNALHRVRCTDKGNLVYLHYLLGVIRKSGFINILVNRATIAHFTRDKFSSLRIPFPSNYEQDVISRFLNKKTLEIDDLITEKEHLIELLEEKRQAVITEAVTKGLDPNVKMKDSGIEWVGEIPEHWGVMRLKYLSTLNPSKSEVSNEKNTRATFIPMENLKSTGEIDYSLTRKVSDVYNGYTYFKEEDIIMAKVTPCFENGNIAIATDLINGIGFGTTEFYVIRANQNIETNYLYYILQSEWFRQEGASSMYGVAGLKRIPSRFISDFKVGLPSLEEQRTIVDFILKVNNQVNDLIKTQKEIITKLKEYRESLIYEAVTGKIDVRDYVVEAEEVH